MGITSYLELINGERIIVIKKNIRFIFFSDTHLGFDFPVRPRINRRRRGQDFFDNFQKVLDFARNARVDFVLHGGDFFFRSKVPAFIIDLAYTALLDFLESGIPFYVVPGNHERSRLPDSLIFSHPNLHVFNEPRTFELNLAAGKLSLTGFPFERNYIRNNFLSLLNQAGWHKTTPSAKLLCMHQLVEGAQVGPWNNTFHFGKDVIKKKDLPSNCAAILVGHIHRRQILKIFNESKDMIIPLIFSGSVERTSFNEKYEKKGFFEIELTEPSGHNWQVKYAKFIKLYARPMIDIQISDVKNIHRIKSYLQAQVKQLDKDAIVRLKFTNPMTTQVRTMLTADFYRNIFPPTMNFQSNTDIFTYKKEQRLQEEDQFEFCDDNY